jgi:hypothetical protein
VDKTQDIEIRKKHRIKVNSKLLSLDDQKTDRNAEPEGGTALGETLHSVWNLLVWRFWWKMEEM